MADNLTKEKRSKVMRSIKSKDTRIETKLRKELWRRGYRYRKNYKKLIGRPDIVFTKKKIAIFCDSEFWHGYNWEEQSKRISSNREYWIPKIEKNIQRDKLVTKTLEDEGWTVLRFWGFEINQSFDQCIQKIEDTIKILDSANDIKNKDRKDGFSG